MTEPREVLEDDEPTDPLEDIHASDVLSDHTGEPKEAYEPDYDEHPIPDLDDVDVIGNGDLAENALEELNRIDVTELDSEGVADYTRALRSVGGLVAELDEPEERQPNARVMDSNGYEVVE